jgi:GT2 family glycosyltransferase
VPHPVQTPSSVSVIVPTYNRRARLERLLRALEGEYTAGPRFEVVVVVDGATDGTETMLAALRPSYPLQVLRQPNRGPAAARNRGVAAAAGEVLVFLDDDVWPTPGLIARHLAVHEHDPAAITVGPMLAPPGRPLAPWLAWEAAALRKQYDAMQAGRFAPTPRQFYTANASVRRAHVLAAGGFNETFTRAEDVELAFRLADRGLRFVFLPEAAVLHEPDRTLAAWLRVPYEYGRHDVRMAWECGRAHLLPLAVRELRQRHPLNRLLPRWCAGRRRLARFVAAAMATALRAGPRTAPTRWQLALCSALFNLQYWRGVADAAGLGSSLWAQLERQRDGFGMLGAAPQIGRTADVG